MSLFSEFTSWQAYAAVILAEAEVAEHQAEGAVRYVEATQMVATWGGTSKDKVTVAKAEQTVDPKVEAARQAFLNAYALRKMSAVMYQNTERAAALLSRELSRRIGAGPTTRRSTQWTP